MAQADKTVNGAAYVKGEIAVLISLNKNYRSPVSI